MKKTNKNKNNLKGELKLKNLNTEDILYRTTNKKEIRNLASFFDISKETIKSIQVYGDGMSYFNSKQYSENIDHNDNDWWNSLTEEVTEEFAITEIKNVVNTNSENE